MPYMPTDIDWDTEPITGPVTIEFFDPGTDASEGTVTYDPEALNLTSGSKELQDFADSVLSDWNISPEDFVRHFADYSSGMMYTKVVS